MKTYKLTVAFNRRCYSKVEMEFPDDAAALAHAREFATSIEAGKGWLPNHPIEDAGWDDGEENGGHTIMLDRVQGEDEETPVPHDEILSIEIEAEEPWEKEARQPPADPVRDAAPALLAALEAEEEADRFAASLGVAPDSKIDALVHLVNEAKALRRAAIAAARGEG